MKQLIQNLKDGNLELKDVPVPLCKSGGILVKTVNSLISIGTEKSLIQLGQQNLVGKAMARPDLLKRVIEKANKEGYLKVYQEVMNRLDEPFPLGYSASGIIVEVGRDVDEYTVGDAVAMSGAGFANHAEYNYIPRNLSVRIPQNVSMEEAAFCMLGGIALQGIREGGVTFGENVTVVGLGLLGMITMQILTAIGCYPFGLDIDDYKVTFAQEMGCMDVINIKKIDPVEYIMAQTGHIGTDCVLITAATKDNAPVELAEKISRQKGRIVLVGVCDIHLHRKYFFDKELNFSVSRAAGPGLLDENYELKGIDYPVGYIRWPERRNIEYFLRLIADGRINIKQMVTQRHIFDDAVSVYEKLLSGQEKSLGVMFSYPSDEKNIDIKELNISGRYKSSESINKSMNIGVIGGGLFAKNVFLPVLKEIKGHNLVGISTTKGMTSEHIASKFGFSYSTTDYKRILDDENIGTVFIMTRHDLHAEMVKEALKRGKNIFVEKPLCITVEELDSIIEAFKSFPERNNFMIGFNRRYSIHAEDVKEFFSDKEPFVINCRINAGFLEPSHWTMDKETGGGRIIGEVCHFVDFLQFVTGSNPVRVYCEGISGSKGFGADDNIVSTLTFYNGSIATITYTSKGSKAYPREIIEIYQSGSIYYLEDFRLAIKIKSGKKEKKKFFSQDMGYKKELEFFFENKASDKEISGYFTNARAVFAIVKSLKNSMVINVNEISRC